VLTSVNTPPQQSGSFAATAPFRLFAKNTNLVFFLTLSPPQGNFQTLGPIAGPLGKMLL
jgi:hypothetical protein